MSKVLACVDGSVYAESVVDHAAWVATRAGLPVELLQVLGRREAIASDRSGRIVAGARRKLLEELAELDSQRAKLLQTEARLVLEDATIRLQSAGVSDVAITLRHGDLVPTLQEREAEAGFVVVGKRGEAADFAKLHLGSNLERIVRASERPIVIASRAFRPIKKALIAVDGSTSSLKAIHEIAHTPLYRDVSFIALTVGEPTDPAKRALERAEAELSAAGLSVSARIEPGKPEKVIADTVISEGIDIVVMGAYGHSRLRSLVIGSTTSALIRACQVPIAVYR